MDEHNLFRREPFGVCDERFARRVRAELKLFLIATHSLQRLVGIERDLMFLFRVAQNSRRRKRIGIADEKHRVARILDHATRKNIGERFRRRHST